METDDEVTESIDQQLGSPGFTFEKGWLAGIVLGLVTIVVVVVRRANRKRDNEGPEVEFVDRQSRVP
jgi:hypothetical protein